MKKVLPLREYDDTGFTRTKNVLYSFLFESLGEPPGILRDAFLLVHPANPGKPESILSEENYKRIVKLMRQVAEQAAAEDAHGTSRET
jgi:hypothetical protein